MDVNEDILLRLIRITITGKSEAIPSCLDWMALIGYATSQGVLGITYDALEKLTPECRPDIDNLMEWSGQVYYQEQAYKEHKEVICQLSKFYTERHIPMVLMKGYGLSLNYPIPNHRPTGDIDLYHCGYGKEADDLAISLGAKIKQNEEKHSTYDIKGIHVENHATIICELEHKTLSGVERFLEEELKNNSVLDEEIGCMLPSYMFNAVYLPLHLGSHFVYEVPNLRQIVDWALFVKTHHSSIDWEKVCDFAMSGGYFKFLCCLNGIVIDYLGISSECFPNWERNKKLEYKVLEEILKSQDSQVSCTSVASKIRRYFNNRWKYQLVYGKESHLKGLFLRSRSWLIWKWGIGGRNIWERHVD